MAADRGPDLLIALDPNGIVRYVNPTGAALYGIDPDDLIDHPLPIELIHPDDRDYAIDSIAEAERLPGEQSPAQIRILDASGEWVMAEVGARTAPIGDSGDRALLLAIRRLDGRDASPLRRQELEVLARRIIGECASAAPEDIEAIIVATLADLGRFLRADTMLLGVVDHDAGTLDFRYEWSPARSWIARHPTLPLSQLQWDAGTVPDRGYQYVGRLDELTRGQPGQLDAFGVTSLVDVIVASHGLPVAVLSALFCDPSHRWEDAHAALVRVIGEVLTVTVQRLGDYRRLQHRTLHDSLTGLPNRDHLVQHLGRMTDTAVLFFCDLDGFKTVNDRWGHGVGDEVLIEVAARISDALRPDDFVARVGGDEFVIVCPASGDDGHGSPWQPSDLAERIERAVCSITAIGNADVAVSVSVGVAVLLPGRSVEHALRDADARMYDIKQLRRALFAESVG